MKSLTALVCFCSSSVYLVSVLSRLRRLPPPGACWYFRAILRLCFVFTYRCSIGFRLLVSAGVATAVSPPTHSPIPPLGRFLVCTWSRSKCLRLPCPPPSSSSPLVRLVLVLHLEQILRVPQPSDTPPHPPPSDSVMFPSPCTNHFAPPHPPPVGLSSFFTPRSDPAST